MSRGQTNTAGVALLILLTVLALGGLTAGIGSMIHSGAAAADTERVADGMGSVLTPAETVGAKQSTLQVSGGDLETKTRTIRILTATGTTFQPGEQAVDVVMSIRGEALVYRSDSRAVVAQGGAVILDTGRDVRMHRAPRMIADHTGGDLRVLGLTETRTTGIKTQITDETTVRIRTNVSHQRFSLASEPYHLAIETTYPDAWAEYLQSQGATIATTDAQFPGDEAGSVVATLSQERATEVIVHHVDLEVAADE